MKIGKIKNLTMQQQVQLNTENIEELAKVIKNVFNTQETLTTASTTIDVSDIVDWDTNTETGLILSKDGLLFDIVAVVDSTVYIKYWASVKGPKGDTGNTGSTGATGNGIASIEKTGTAGLVDTYTITFTNGQTTTFTVTNGQDGQTGATGNGIASVEKTSTAGLVDTYTITFTNGQTTTFDVTNGANGTNGTNGQDGADFTALTYKGQWTSGTDYNKFDLVYIEANSVRTFYMLLNNVTNSTVSPDLDTTNFKEMFEIPVSSGSVQSQRIRTYSDLTTLISNGKKIINMSFANSTLSSIIFYTRQDMDIEFDANGQNLPIVTKNSYPNQTVLASFTTIYSNRIYISSTAVNIHIGEQNYIYFNSSGCSFQKKAESYILNYENSKIRVSNNQNVSITDLINDNSLICTAYYI